jgi:hypothetical protein
VKDQNGDLLEHCHNILNSWENYFAQLLNVHVSDIWQIGVHTAEPLVLGPSRLEVEITIAKLKKYNSPGSDEIPAELIQGGGEILLCEIYKLIILFGIRKNYLVGGRSLLLYQFTKRVIKLTVVIIVGYHWYHLHTKCYRISSSPG